MKTAMTLMKEYLDECYPESTHTLLHSKATELLNKEKEQIINAYNKGKWDNISKTSLGGGLLYYQETF